MKKTAFISAFIILAMSGLFAQECENYFPTETGATWTMTHYDGKNNVQSTQKSTVVSSENKDGGILTTISTTSYDDKEKQSYQNTFTTLCKEGVFYMDMKTFMPPTEGNDPNQAQMQMEAANMEIPSNLTVGQTLPDAWIKMFIQVEGMPPMAGQTIMITNRTVEGFESITTPAGTFECVKISWDTEMKMMFAVKSKTIAWYSLGVGTVKSETYDKKGKLEGTSILTAFSK